ncbi:hypothetical protein JG687_00015482 [Phytophthora cactorum]|uniref:Uncharacterized protein n=1 Tax=Phytophthora cactorum TaxID=29920 RepID=A0A8T1TWS9_9STRA|nr:hypothetical protein JG687_00015482 [Phytophthora cactorum]
MDRELRVKAVEKGVGSAAKTAGSTSRHSKQGRSDGLVHPQSVQGDEQDDQQIEVLVPPLQRSEFESWGAWRST